MGPKTLNKEKTVLNSIDEAVDYLKRQDLPEFFQTDNRNIRCPFHDDINPSASFCFKDGFYYLKCHSNNCSFGSGTIIDIVKRYFKIDGTEAFNKLMKIYNIEIDDPWKDEYEAILINNIDIVNKSGLWKERYPHLYKCISRIKYDLVSKIELARDKTTLKSKNDEPVFYCSLREFERVAKRNKSLDHHNGQNMKVDRYCLLGLMKKINLFDLSKSIQKRINDNKDYDNHISIYHIPEYTEELLSKANTIARTLKDRGVRMNAISRPLVLDIFGEKRAKEIYPQVDSGKPGEENNSFLQALEPILLFNIEKQGYASVPRIIEELLDDYDWKSVTDRRVKKYIPGLLIKHNLIETQSNKVLKQKYNIDSKGYPKIIIRKSDTTEE